MFFEVHPITLEVEGLRLEPLSQEHAQGLFNRGQYQPDWQFMPRSCFITEFLFPLWAFSHSDRIYLADS